ncbi:unnamed protein product, partial [Gulo gulo]
WLKQPKRLDPPHLTGKGRGSPFLGRCQRALLGDEGHFCSWGIPRRHKQPRCPHRAHTTWSPRPW